MLMLKLYHENIVRVLNKNEKQLMFMTGMLEIKGEENTVYVTISESEKEGLNYNNKLRQFYSLLVNSGCEVQFLDGTSKLTIDTSYKQKNDFTENMYDKIKDIVFFEKNDTLNYSSIIKNYKITVKLINSTNYLNQRETGRSFLPFKRIQPDGKVECIFGSLCVEAKLFGYMYLLNKKWEDFVGYIAYWIGNDLPPNHILKKYNYIKNTEDDNKLEQTFNKTIQYLNENTKTQLNDLCKNISDENVNANSMVFQNNPLCKNIITSVIQPIALTCPGCYLNWQSYINNIQPNWDISVCSTVNAAPVNKVGGKNKNVVLLKKLFRKLRSKKTKKNKRKNKSIKRKSISRK